jgi:hypothetical protein
MPPDDGVFASNCILFEDQFRAAMRRGADINVPAIRRCCEYLLMASSELKNNPLIRLEKDLSVLKRMLSCHIHIRPATSLLNCCLNFFATPEGRSIIANFYRDHGTQAGRGELLPRELEELLVPLM